MSGQRPSVGPPRSTHATYHPDGYGVSEGLKRARRPFLLRNAVTGGAILGFVVGVYYYSISKVQQDEFADEAPRASGVGAGGAAGAGGSSVSLRPAPSANTPSPIAAQATHFGKADAPITAEEERRAAILRAQGRLV